MSGDPSKRRRKSRSASAESGTGSDDSVFRGHSKLILLGRTRSRFAPLVRHGEEEPAMKSKVTAYWICTVIIAFASERAAPRKRCACRRTSKG